MSSFLLGGVNASYGFNNLTVLISWLMQGVFLWLNKEEAKFLCTEQTGPATGPTAEM